MRLIKCLFTEMDDVVDDNYMVQKIFTGKGLLGEEIYKRSLFQNAGYSRILTESDIVIAIEDNQTITAVASETADRPILSDAGDTAVYASETIYIKIQADKTITIDNGEGTIVLNSDGQVRLNGSNLTVDP